MCKDLFWDNRDNVFCLKECRNISMVREILVWLENRV